MIVIRDKKGNVTKVVITQREYDDTSKDYKGLITKDDMPFYNNDIKKIGKRTWMPPVWVYGYTCLLVEGKAFEIIETPKDETDFIIKSFWSWLLMANDRYNRGDWDYYKPSSYESFFNWLSMEFGANNPEARTLYDKFCKEYNVTPSEKY